MEALVRDKGAASFATEHCRPGQETTSLAKQVEWAMAFNRRSERPVSLHTTSWQGPVAAAAARINSHTWDVTCHTQPLLQVFTPEQASWVGGWWRALRGVG
ncbi:RNA (guanine-9-)-methyltransferasedomain-containing protein 3, partial [Haematococcus lacustris]